MLKMLTLLSWVVKKIAFLVIIFVLDKKRVSGYVR